MSVDEEFYEGRTFDPIIYEERSPENEAVIETTNMPSTGMLCVKIHTPAGKGSTISLNAGIKPNNKWTSAYPHGLELMVSVSKEKGVFAVENQVEEGEPYAAGASQGLEASMNCIVGSQRGYTPLEPDTDYYWNIAHLEEATNKKDPVPDIRAQINFSVKG